MATKAEIDLVEHELGRTTKAEFEIVVSDKTGRPVVIRNQPFCFDGEPMPTLYWLIGKDEIASVGRIESAGGVDQAEREVPAEDIEATHAAYAKERDSFVPDNYGGPLPTGGVGGTRTGVKCLHAHLAYLLAGGDDPVGVWTVTKLNEIGEWNDMYVRKQ